MNRKDSELRGKEAENLRLAAEVGRRVARIRELFEERLKEHPLYIWNPSIWNFRRQELWGYGLCKLEGEFEFVVLPQQGVFMPSTSEVLCGRYDLDLFTDGTSLPNSRIQICGTVGGYGPIDYILPPVGDIGGRDLVELNNLRVKIDRLESLLKLIGLLPDEEAVDTEEGTLEVIKIRRPKRVVREI